MARFGLLRTLFRCFTATVVLTLGAASFVACSESDCTPGSEACVCNEGQCLAGLVCLSDTCVQPGGSGGEGGGGGAGGSGGAAGMGGLGGMGGAGGAGGRNNEDPFAGCIERPPGDTACGCNPFDPDSCSGDTACGITFILDPNEGFISALPALDGSDIFRATECIPDRLKLVEEGAECQILGAGSLVRGDCLQGLHCEHGRRDNRKCVRFCLVQADCTSGSCLPLLLSNPGFSTFGRCL